MNVAVKVNNNIIPYNTSKIQVALNEFFDNRLEHSEQTYKNYMCWINEFLDVVVNKNINNITWDDIEIINRENVVMFRNHLKQKGNKAQTINNKMSAIKSLFKNCLVAYNTNININVVNVEDLVVNKVEEYGALTETEVSNLIQFARTQTCRPLVQGLFFETLFRTATRFSATYNLTVDKFKQETNNKTGRKIWTIQTNDKRQKNTMKPLTDEFYQKLIDISIDGRVFKIAEKTLRNTFKEFCKMYDIEENRNITPHSLKKASIDFVFDMANGDMAMVGRHSGNKDYNTLFNSYIGKTNHLEEQLALQERYKEYDITQLQNCTKEELLDLIEKSGVSIIRKLIEEKERIE